ncbi:MAG TPA: CPBP family intramembrane metalloprotease [Smithellaceae bacterium]|nr:CPBP family intramembrane metalloprotease [Smithellaceae bacterium]
MAIEKYRHPVRFYGLVTLTTWTFWFAAAYLSRITPANQLLAEIVGILSLLGLLCPALIAFGLIWPNSELRNDVQRRIIGIRSVQSGYLFLACFLMIFSILLAQAISLLFGHSLNQFHLSGKASFSSGIISGWFALIFAPFMEELGWHSYGTDCLRRSMNLLQVCLLFGFYWALWHMPLGLVKGSYQSNLAATGILYSLNYVFSFIAYVILVNWLYYKAHRSILVAIVFHLTANISAEIFATHPDSKVIQTILLLILAAILVIRDRDFFFKRGYGL